MKDAIPHYIRLIATKIRKTDYPNKLYKCSTTYQLNAQGTHLLRRSNWRTVPSIPMNCDIQTGCACTEMIPVNQKVLL